MLRVISAILGVMFIAVGVLGFMPAYIQDGKLFGYFAVDQMHDVIHIAFGVVALLAASKTSAARNVLRLIGIIYLVLAIVGFVRGGDLYMMHVNMADNVLHVSIAIVALFFGFCCAKCKSR